MTILLAAAISGATALFAQEVPAVLVVAVEVKREVVTEKFTLTGTVTPSQEASLSPRASGLVAQVHVDAGAEVTAGTVLLTLDSALAQLALQAAEAAHAQAQAQSVESQRLLAEARRLLDRNSIPETLAMTRKAEAAIATAASQRTAAARAEQQERLDRHQVIAPFNGVITRKLTEAGEWVTTGTPVMRLVALANARIDVQVPQERLGEISSETPVEFELSTAPGVVRTGRITARIPVSDPNTRSALVRIEPREGSPPIMPGKSARVTFLIASGQAVLTVPRDAVIRRADGTVNAWVAERAGETWTASMRRLDLGRTFSDQVEIVNGLEPGQMVITRGNETLRPGQAVQLMSEPPQP